MNAHDNNKIIIINETYQVQALCDLVLRLAKYMHAQKLFTDNAPAESLRLVSRAGSVSVFTSVSGFGFLGGFLKVGVGFGFVFFKFRDIGFVFFHTNFLCLTVSQLSLLGQSKIYDVITVSPNAQQFETGSCL